MHPQKEEVTVAHTRILIGLLTGWALWFAGWFFRKADQVYLTRKVLDAVACGDKNKAFSNKGTKSDTIVSLTAYALKSCGRSVSPKNRPTKPTNCGRRVGLKLNDRSFASLERRVWYLCWNLTDRYSFVTRSNASVLARFPIAFASPLALLRGTSPGATNTRSQRRTQCKPSVAVVQW